MPRRGDDAEAEPLQIVVRAAHEIQFVLTTVARPGVDVADREAARPVGSWQVEIAAQPAKVTQQGEHQRSAQA